MIFVNSVASTSNNLCKNLDSNKFIYSIISSFSFKKLSNARNRSLPLYISASVICLIFEVNFSIY